MVGRWDGGKMGWWEDGKVGWWEDGMVGRWDGGKMGWWEGRNKQTYHLREQKQQCEYKAQAEMTIKG